MKFCRRRRETQLFTEHLKFPEVPAVSLSYLVRHTSSLAVQVTICTQRARCCVCIRLCTECHTSPSAWVQHCHTWPGALWCSLCLPGCSQRVLESSPKGYVPHHLQNHNHRGVSLWALLSTATNTRSRRSWAEQGSPSRVLQCMEMLKSGFLFLWYLNLGFVAYGSIYYPPVSLLMSW